MRFPEFKGEWGYSSLGRECDVLCGYPFDGQAILEKSGNVKLLRGINITEGEIRHSDELDRYYSGDILKLKKYILCEGDLVLSMDGSKVGRNSAILTNLENGAYLVQRICRIRSQKHNVKYIFQHINNSRFHQYVDSVKTASAIPHISQSDIQNYIIPFPPTHEEQIKITNLLSLLDEHIATQSKIIEDLKLLKNELLKKVFFQELRLPEFNENWKIVTLSDVGTFFSGGTPSTSIGQYYNGNIPFIKSGEINADNTEQFISEEGLRNSSAKMVEIGDLIYALYGATSGEVGISKIKGAINQAVLCIRTNLNSIFLLNFLMFKKEEILRTYLQGGQGNLSAEIIKSLKIPVPVHAEQTKLSHLFSAFDKKIELETNIMTKFMQQKQYLLANLFI